MRLDKVSREYVGRVRVVTRPFPLEVYGGGPPNRHELDQEWWLAALQEPAAIFGPYQNADWPATTLPAFEAVWCALQLDQAAARRLDLRIRRAFFAESMNIGRREIYPDLAREAGLDVPAFKHLFETSQPREAVLNEGRLGKETFHVESTPTLMTASGKHLPLFMAMPHSEDNRVISVDTLPCCGEGCYQAVRGLFNEVLAV